MSKKILLDLVATQPMGSAKRHGGGKYGEIVLHRMIERNIPIACYYNSAKWLNPETLEIIRSHGIELFDINGSTIDEVFAKSGCSVIYSALPQYNLFHFTGCKVICTIHGLRTLETPADSYIFKYKNAEWKKWIGYLAKKVIPEVYKGRLRQYKLREWDNPMIQFVTVSNHSANSIKVYFPELRGKEIPVFYSPSTSSQKELKRVSCDKFFMLVSAHRPEKNNLRVIQALDKLFSEGYLEGYKVKITGGEDDSVFRYKIRNRDRFDFVGFVTEEELEQLYHDAYVFIYPSLNEGFGYPPLEAMHYGVPVLASPFTSIPEVCEGAALYFNPFSVEEIAARILQITNKDVHSEMSRRSLSQYAKITARQKADLDALIDYITQETI